MATYYYSIHAYRNGKDLLGDRDDNGNHLLFSTPEKARDALEMEITKEIAEYMDETGENVRVVVDPLDFGRFSYIHYWEFVEAEILFVIARHKLVA